MRRAVFYFILYVMILLIACGKKESVGDSVAVTIGSKNFTKDDVNDFSAMKFLFPMIREDTYFPGKVSNTTLFVTTNALFKKSLKYRKEIESNKSYKLLKMAFLGHIYNYSIIKRRLGSSDEELEEYYNKVRKRDLDAFGGDGSNFYRQELVVEESLFVEKYFPKSETYENIKGDSRVLARIWSKNVKKDLTGFFISMYFKEKYGDSSSLDYETIVNRLHIITEDEINTVLSWFPQKYLDERGAKFKWKMTRQILGWKLFNEKIKNRSIAKQLNVDNKTEWFHKYSYVYFYLNEIIYQKFKSSKDGYTIDSTFLQYRYQTNSNSTYDSLAIRFAKDKTDQFIRKIRQKFAVKFYTDVIHDNFDFTASQLLAKGDSLYKALSSSDKAMLSYIQITNYYGAEPEAITAYKKMGDISFENNEYGFGINAYLEYLLRSDKDEDHSKIFFNIAYMAMKEDDFLLSRAFFKLILKRYPNSKEISDIEFLMNHLDEPQVDIDELQLEAKRQGKN